MAVPVFPVDLITWRALFPEFRTATDDLVQSRLDLAALYIDGPIWGEKAGEGHVYLTAHLLAISPNGQHARLQSDNGSSVYKNRYDELCVQVGAFVFRVI